MSNFDKFKEIFKIAEPLSKPFLPGGVGKVLDVVNTTLNNGGSSGTSAQALQQLAIDNDQQTQAILAQQAIINSLLDRLSRVEQRVQTFGGK